MEKKYKDDEVLSLKKIIIDYALHWRLFLVAGLVSLILALSYLIFYPKTFEAFAMVKLQDDKDLGSGGAIGLGEAAGLMRSFGMGSKMGGNLNVEDEMAVLLSNNLIGKVVKTLSLDVTYNKPFSFEKLYHDNAPVTLEPDPSMRATLDHAIRLDVKVKGDQIQVTEKRSGGKRHLLSSLPGKIKLKEGELEVLATGNKENQHFEAIILPYRWVAEDLSKTIKIEEYSKNANTLEIAYRDHNKLRGREMLEHLVAEYNTMTNHIKHEEGNKSLKFLESRIDNIVSQLQAQEQQIEQYKLKNKMTDIEYDVKFYSEAIKNYREKIIELEAQNHILGLLEEYASNPANKYSLIPAMLTGGESEKGSAVSLYNAALIEREKLQATTKGSSPLSVISENQLDKLRNGVFVSIANARESVGHVMEDLQMKENEIMHKMSNVPVYEREYLDLKRQQEILQGVYLVLLQKKEEIALSLGSDRNRGFETDPAYIKKAPVAPRKLFAAIFIFVFTLITPIAYMFIKKQVGELIAEYKKR